MIACPAFLAIGYALNSIYSKSLLSDIVLGRNSANNSTLLKSDAGNTSFLIQEDVGEM